MTDVDDFRISSFSADEQAVQPCLEFEFDVDFRRANIQTGRLLDGMASTRFVIDPHEGVSLPVCTVSVSDDHNLRNERETLQGWIELTHQAIDKIESIRDTYDHDGDLDFKFQFSLLLYSDNNGCYRGSFSASDTLPTREWIAVLESLGHHDHRVIEVSIPSSDIGDIMDNAMGQIQLAEEHHDAHRYDDALTAVRKAMEKLQHLDNDEELMRQLDDGRRERVDEAIQEFSKSIHNLEKIADLGAHTEERITELEGPILRRDSELAIDVGKSYVRFISRVLTDG
jgi:tetratricopeptide (TPR) repeat protein